MQPPHSPRCGRPLWMIPSRNGMTLEWTNRIEHGRVQLGLTEKEFGNGKAPIILTDT